MGVISQLDVVNDMLATIGEAPVNSLTTEHPLVSRGLNFLRVANAREQGKGWWFNTERITLPLTNGRAILPDGTLKVDAADPRLDCAQRGRYLYRLNAGTSAPYKFDAPVDAVLVRLLSFDDIPAMAQMLVSAAAQLDFIVGLDGDDSKIAQLRTLVREQLVMLNAEHIRAVNANLLMTPYTVAVLGSLSGRSGRRLAVR